MYGGPGNPGDDMAERITDNWIQQNVPGGLNSPMGRQLDNMMGGNPNPTAGQVYGSGAPGFGNMMGGNPNPAYGPAYGQGGPGFGNMGGPRFPGQYGEEHHHHHHHHDHHDHY